MPIVTRRAFLAVTSALGAVAAGSPLNKYLNRLIPYVQPPPETVPGEWTPFATTCRECPAGCGMLQMHRDGRVTKAEGNPEHPINRGALCARGQSSLQGLYDPDRVKSPLRRDRRSGAVSKISWATAYQEVANLLRDGAGRVALLSRLETGTLRETMETFTGTFHSDRLLFYEPYGLEPLRQAHQLLYGLPEIPQYHLDESGHIISFGADFLETWVSPVGLARGFSESHGWKDGTSGRFTYVGPRLSMTAANADDFLMVRPGVEQWVALALLKSMAEEGLIRDGAVRGAVIALGGDKAAALAGVREDLVRDIARSFVTNRGVALAVPDAASGPAPFNTAVLAGLLNEAAGAVGTRVDFSRTHAMGRTAPAEAVERFLNGITERDVVVVHQANIAFTHPGAAERLRRAAAVIYLGTLPDETAQIADWVLPVDYPLESWGDYEPYSGIHGVMQPVMARLWDTRGAGEILLEVMRVAGGGPVDPTGMAAATAWAERIRRRWGSVAGAASLHDILMRGFVEKKPAAAPPRLRAVPSTLTLPAPEAVTGAQLWAWPSIMFYDGRTANRGWIQEAPDPVSYASWSSWIDIHPDLAKRLDVGDGELVELSVGGSKVQAGARVTREILDGVVGIVLGQGHTAAGLSVAGGIGANAFVLLDRASAGIDNFPAVSVRGMGRLYPAVYTSPTKGQHRRELLQSSKASEEARKRPGEGDKIDMPTPEGYDPQKNLYPPHRHRLHRWAMVIDLQKCIGCGACAVACYAENNIPVMGRKYVSEGREMAWLKVVPYQHPEKLDKISWLPLPCQHCDAAPCEPVCPVYAAVHNEEGLNAQIYNRCIGTRYCSNNCPYKVRRFNWFDPEWKKPLDQQLNPEVTVRCRGVMEKCTFCVQRIRKAEYQAIQENRPLRDGEVVPACMQTCPTGVFSFGDLHDPNSEVSRRFKEDPRRYQVLKELNTKPAVLYLKKIER